MFLFFGGAANTAYLVPLISVTQREAPDYIRGRVMASRFLLAQTGLLGGIALAGPLSDRLGAPLVFVAAGFLLICSAVVGLAFKNLRNASLRDIPEAVDLAVIVVPKAIVPSVVEDAVERKVKGLVVISAGYRETGDAGAREEAALRDRVRSAGIRMIGPNCMGVINTDPEVRMNATFAATRPARGTVGFMSQSGALGEVILARAHEIGLGIAYFVSMGNKADVSGNDLIEAWEDDPRVNVILMYLESFGNPAKFAGITRRVTRKKPILAVKSGRTAAGEATGGPQLAAPTAWDLVPTHSTAVGMSIVARTRIGTVITSTPIGTAITRRTLRTVALVGGGLQRGACGCAATGARPTDTDTAIARTMATATIARTADIGTAAATRARPMDVAKPY